MIKIVITFITTEYGCAIPVLVGFSHVEKGNI
jgi:hypothetical protein